MMVDSRHGFTPLDKQLLDFVSQRVATGEVKLLVLLTKADKLNRKEADAALRATSDQLAALATEQSDVAVTLFSALSKKGVGDVAQVLYAWRSAERVAAPAPPPAPEV
jgi:GTP-binding protein